MVINPIPSAQISVANAAYFNTSTNTASVPAAPGYTYDWTITGGTIIGSSNSNPIVFAVGQAGTTVHLQCIVTSPSSCSGTGNGAVVCVYQPFTAGNLAILRQGDGAEPLVANGNSVFIDKYTTNGTRVQTIALPDNGTNAILEDPTSTVEGNLTLSMDGTVLAPPGYNVALTNNSAEWPPLLRPTFPARYAQWILKPIS